MRLQLLAMAALAASCGAAAPQSMTPMRGEVTSFGDAFAVRVFPYNPYRHRIRVVVRVYDADFLPVEARVSPAEMMLGSRDTRPVLVEVPFGKAAHRRVRVCTESVPFPNRKTRIRAQICGRFLARRAG
ncbi:hypothetical protein [Nitratireductor sp. ZSWI3]|uniref:hypothetical protein n=1 Tax=Nitratireductor sp. ZSWI3 TaxID=2966359 RepID=UPI00214F8E55|nr:hypothetical protein [Nitratireductor sp. ZSWI3]MCR4267812.1 hypothetical protein [Nitratireductor sp. ZSWI3]